jgi:hypothetical protein
MIDEDILRMMMAGRRKRNTPVPGGEEIRKRKGLGVSCGVWHGAGDEN